MNSLRRARVAGTVLGALALATSASAETVTKSVAVRTQVQPQTSLHVSATSLQFEIGGASGVRPVAVEFQAAARTHHDGEVLLTVQQDALVAAGDASSSLPAIVWTGEGIGTQGGMLADQPSVAARWQGSGRREGRLVFSLTSAQVLSPGQYAAHLRFVLCTP